MARFQFAYASVLRYRELRERQAELKQWEAHSYLQSCIAEEKAFREEMQTTAAGLQPRLGQKQSLEAWLALYRQVDRLELQCKAAQLRIAKATRAWQEASAERNQAAQQAEVLRRLSERQRQEHADALAKHEQRFLDEVGMQRWGRMADSDEP